MIRIDGATLMSLALEEALTARRASRVASMLGSLACWWLTDELLRTLARDPTYTFAEAARWLQRPRLGESLGSCWIILAHVGPQRGSALREAFPLPLRWVADRPHSDRLPIGLLRIADQAHRDVGFSSRAGLSLDPRIDDVDLSRLPEWFSYDSAWASLSAGLTLLQENSVPDPKVWASGSRLGASAVASVSEVPAKARAAADWGAEVLFVPSGQTNEATLPGLTLLPFTSSTTPMEAMGEYCARLGSAPPRVETDAGRRRRVEHWARLQRRQPSLRTDYYRRDLLPSIVESRRAAVSQAALDRPTLLITIASTNPESALLTAASLRPLACVLLHDGTSTMAGPLKFLEENLANYSRATRIHPERFVNDETIAQQFRAIAQRYGEGHAPEQIAFDLTPGDKLMSLAILLSAASAGNRLIYVRHRYHDAARLPEPFTESFRITVAGRPWDEIVVV